MNSILAKSPEKVSTVYQSPLSVTPQITPKQLQQTR